MLRHEREKGQGMAELALALPILLMVVFGMVEMARLVQTYLAVQHAAREGARYAVVGLPSEQECAVALHADPNDPCQARLVNGDICPTEYSGFRAEEIKAKARLAAVGLPWNPAISDQSRPGYLGVRVQGQPSFYDDCDPLEDCLDCPGVPGARVKVEVCFNMPVITPILSGALPTVRVCANTQMINEGFQTWVGAQAPPILSPLPTLAPIDTDGDGLYDSQEYTDQCTYVTNPDSDYDGINDGTEASQPGWDPCDPYNPYTPTPEIEPATPTNTATPTPVPFRMNKPLLAGSWRVTGAGDWTYPPQVHIIDNTTGQEIGSGTIRTTDPGRGSFTIDLWLPLVAGHQITAIGSYPGARDTAVVVGATNTPTNTPTSTNTPTPTSTRTPTATPTPSARITIANPTPPAGQIYSCTDAVGSPLNMTVQGSGWPAAAEVLFGWDGTGATERSYTGNATATPDGGGNFTASFTVSGSKVTEGKHTLYALVILTGQQAQAPLYVPCSSVPSPTPTWTATPVSTPTFTPTPVRKPDLRISALSIQPTNPVTGTLVTINTTVWNDSTGPCNNTFWTDLYVRTEPTPPAFRDDGVKYQALTYLAPNGEKLITFLDYTFAMTGTYYLYTQADTYQNVGEISEDNNASQPLMVTVQVNPNPPTATPIATPADELGSIGGTVRVFIGGQVVVPGERVNVSVWKGGEMVATTESGVDGSYYFCTDADDNPYFCIAAGTGYTVDGLVIIDGTIYYGYQTGIDVVNNGETGPVTFTLFP
ncbi:MAG TPA: TadE/TadG family type IV pilus assembly protein [Anaerolineae bacterium]|nr:TadE/TadG family type IV pilus assembly protein [Anaerolineae bacterium]